MYGYHLQQSADGWGDVLSAGASGVWHKAVTDVHLLRDAKRFDPRCRTILRYYNDNYAPFVFVDDKIDGARRWFAQYIDGTFATIAQFVDVVETVNEVYGNGQNAAERKAFADFEVACTVVWERDFAHRWPWIRLCLANTAIGNDTPIEVARAAARHDHVIGYHPYVPVRDGRILEDEWRFYSGRWAVQDAAWKREGIVVRYLGTEAGPVGFDVDPNNGNIHLRGGDGWRSDIVYNHDLAATLACLEYHARAVRAWNLANDNRWLGSVLFTTDRVAQGTWRKFQWDPAEMGTALGHFRGWPVPVWTPEFGGGEPPPDPPSYERVCWLLPQNLSRDQYLRICEMAYPNRRTVLFSADDALITHDYLRSRRVVVYGTPPGGSRAAFEAYVDQWYLDDAGNRPSIVYADLPRL